MELKTKAVRAALRCDEDLYSNTGDPRYAWDAWSLARRAKIEAPPWVLRFIDGVARSESASRSRTTDTEGRYDAALTQIEVAIAAHARRRKIRHVAQQLGVTFAVSRRDRPNLSAIARTAAKANGVSVNRLLARYRSSLKPTRR